MTGIEFRSRFCEFLASNDIKTEKVILDFEWNIFQGFQRDLCRDVSFEEYFETVEADWMEAVSQMKPKKLGRPKKPKACAGVKLG